MLISQFVHIGSVVYGKQERIKSVISEEKKYAVLLPVTEDPHVSTREIFRQHDIDQTTVLELFHKHNMHY